MCVHCLLGIGFVLAKAEIVLCVGQPTPRFISFVLNGPFAYAVRTECGYI
jgi:hypothetical protein